MNAIVKVVIISGLLIALGAAVNAMIASSFIQPVNDALVYFMTALKPMDLFVPIDTVYTCMQIVGNFLFGVAGFFLVRWVIHLYAN